jgi:2'-5' RNA ligase
MSNTKRLFIAAPVPPDLKEVFRQHQAAFKQPAVRFLPDENLHLTVHFLGEVPADQVMEIQQGLQQLAATQENFQLTFECLEPGPKPKSPRLIWARFRPHPAFTQLCAAVFQQMGIRPPDHAEYIPHITLARFRKDAPRPVSLPIIYPPEPNFLMPVNSVALWQSELKSPQPVYHILAEYTLGVA